MDGAGNSNGNAFAGTVVTSGIRCVARPDAVLLDILPRWIGSQRFIYNAKVEEDRLFSAQWRIERRHYPLTKIPTPLDQTYSHFKSDELTPWLSEVPSVVLRNGAFRWMTAKTRQLKGTAKAPRKRNPWNFDSVLLTSDVFRFVPHPQGGCDKAGNPRRRIEIGTRAKPMGFIDFDAKRPYALPKMLTVRKTASGKWYVSFNFDETLDIVLRSESELAYELNGLSDDELQVRTLGIDRNVAANKLATSDGRFHDLRDIETQRIERKEKRTRKYQRKMARQQKGSSNRRKTARKVAKMQGYGANVRKDFAHRTSRTLLDAGYDLYVFEDLNIKGMTKKPRAKQDEAGRYLPNGRAAKKGLAKSILASAWGLTEQFLRYKAARKNALVVSVPAMYSSQECAECGHVAKENRKGSRFKCVSCGHEDHADANASRNIRRRGIALIRSRALEGAGKAKRKTSFRRKPQSQEGSDRPGLSVETAEDQKAPFGAAGSSRRSGNRSLPKETSILGVSLG